ncbi:unnamed protein product [Prorocentrum cordatum]|uniref:Palmitoyltransferase n=1 Tax=Prorocentrum cordatum TaxID=2364126 RepID=A0ABN9S1G9_9DINO|nr:unnamed protein product [Polarella glacialis]
MYSPAGPWSPVPGGPQPQSFGMYSALGGLPPLPHVSGQYYFETCIGILIVSALIAGLTGTTTVFLDDEFVPPIGHHILLPAIWICAATATLSMLWILFAPAGEVTRSPDKTMPIPDDVMVILQQAGPMGLQGRPNVQGPGGSSYCTRCFVWRPPNSHHCSTCQRCYTGFDHHCCFFGRCIRSGNLVCFYAVIACGGLGVFITLVAWQMHLAASRHIPIPVAAPMMGQPLVVQ